MNIEEMTIGELRQISSMFGQAKDQGPWVIGQKYIIHTATLYYTGKLSFVGSMELHLDDAALIFDQGRHYNSLKDGSLNEVEPVPIGGVVIGRGAIISAEQWNHELPREQK